MRKVMIIDDDVPMLRYLEQIIQWEELNLQVVATAFSSVKALEIFREKNPDIVISDIGMPQIDGIELASRIREINSAVRIIFVTCHEDFGYARSAVRLQADDYLIKDELTPKKLSNSLQKASRVADELRDRIDQLSFREELEHHRDQVKKQLWRQLVGKMNEQRLQQLLEKVGIRWELPRFMLAVVAIDYASLLEHYRYEDMDLIHYAFFNIAEETAGTWSPVTIIPLEQAGKFVFILNYKPNLAVNIHKEFETYLERLRLKIKDYLKIEMRGAISGELHGLGALKAAYERLMEFQRMIYYEDSTVSHMPDEPLPVWTADDQEFKRYKEDLLLANEKRSLSALETVVEQMEHYARIVMLNPKSFWYHLSQMLRALDYEWNFQYDKENLYTLLPHTVSSREAVLLAKQHINKIGGAQVKERKELTREPRLHEINEYITINLAENVSSVSVANHLFLNPSYFSRYFKKIAGVNFTEYVHRYKMNIAKQLFEQGEAVEMVAIKLGYSDRTYFSKVFKKYIGISPQDYKSTK
ncbi:response regulator [Paenibacillus sp. IITD108]